MINDCTFKIRGNQIAGVRMVLNVRTKRHYDALYLWQEQNSWHDGKRNRQIVKTDATCIVSNVDDIDETN